MKPMTITEKILATKAGKDFVQAGETHWCKIDRIFTHDPCSPGVIGIFNKEFGEDAPIFSKQNYIMIPDHFVYTTDDLANGNLVLMREFAKRKGVEHFYDVGTPDYKGVCHVAMVEGGHVRPNELMLGTDSHTVTAGAFGCFAIGVGNTDAAYALGTGEILLKVPQSIKVQIEGKMPDAVSAKDLILFLLGQLGVNGATYKTLEFCGSTLEAMGAEERMTLCNMATEAGAKSGIIAPNQASTDYLRALGLEPEEGLQADEGANYIQTIKIEASKMVPIVAKPNSPDHSARVTEVSGTKVNQVYLGSCTGGKLEDFRAFAAQVAGRKVQVPTFAVPATQSVFNDLIKEKIAGVSLYEILQAAGVLIAPNAGCAACCGGPKGTFGRVDTALTVVSTTNRNFPGRMGNKEARVFLTSAQTAAATALMGVITDPRNLN
ncbi:MAG: aconitase/3-isopropylmalate dehydratase large subunit family protein [SAR324 cluster bacterium]|nr:aconitase/3-isopropylmalate dehydratase large subunit family protein [SAR324 cluster bacterium]